MKLRLSEWASIADIVGAAAIVVSLLFVGLQIRNSARQTELNTQALQMSAYQSLIGEVNNQSRFFIEELPDWWFEQPGDLSAHQRNQQANFFLMAIRFGDLAFYQHELGMLSDDRLESVIGVLRNMWCRPQFIQFWNGGQGPGFRDNVVSSYRQFVDAGISESCSAGNSE